MSEENFKKDITKKNDREVAAICSFCHDGRGKIEVIMTEPLKNYLDYLRTRNQIKDDSGYRMTSVDYCCVFGKEDCVNIQTYRMMKKLEKRVGILEN